MITRIRNPWIRRLVLIVYCTIAVPFTLILDVLIVFVEWFNDEWRDSIRACWKGPRK